MANARLAAALEKIDSLQVSLKAALFPDFWACQVVVVADMLSYYIYKSIQIQWLSAALGGPHSVLGQRLHRVVVNVPQNLVFHSNGGKC